MNEFHGQGESGGPGERWLVAIYKEKSNNLSVEPQKQRTLMFVIDKTVTDTAVNFKYN